MFISLSFYRTRCSRAGRWLWHPHNSSISEFKVAVAIVTSQRARGKACPYFSLHCLSGTHSFHSIPTGYHIITNPQLASRNVGRWSLAGWPYAHLKLLRRQLVFIMVQAWDPGVYSSKYLSVLSDPEPRQLRSPIGLCLRAGAEVPTTG